MHNAGFSTLGKPKHMKTKQKKSIEKKNYYLGM